MVSCDSVHETYDIKTERCILHWKSWRQSS